MSQQQTVLRVYSNSLNEQGNLVPYDFLDLYNDIPIKINKSIAELQDISSKNSDFSVGLSLPGSKRNNRFFESFFNVDAQSLYFSATQKVLCDVLLNNQSYFTGYMRLNKVSVLNSKIEYDVTLFSTIGNLFGDIGNNLLKDLNFDDPEYTFNHTFDFYDSIADPYENQSSNFGRKNTQPFLYYYPIVHNGYEYTGSTVNVSGGTAELQTRLYTSTLPIGSFPSLSGLTGYKPYRINSQGSDDGLIDNQLKPALSVWGLIKLIFKTYGYTITSDFMNTPWMKTLYMYGYFSSEATKFSYKLVSILSLPPEGVELIYSGSTSYGSPLKIIVCKRGTGVPCYSTSDINYAFANMFPYSEFGTIPAGTSGVTINTTYGFDFGFEVDGVPVADISTLRYTPKNIGEIVYFVDGDDINFSLVVDPNIKQIDILSSVSKKFNLIFIPDPNNYKNIKIESYPYYIGTGNVYDWTPKLSYDKGFTVEPALNYIESNLIFTDQEDGDYGNKQFKDRNKQIYGQMNFYGPTDFKSQEKKIETTFSPEVLRQWDTADQLGTSVNQGIKLPLGINYVGSSSTQEVGNSTQTFYAYKGVKSKPKLFWFLGSSNLFLDTLGEAYATSGFTTYDIRILNSNKSQGRSVRTAPIISHTMPMGMSDSAKINNDSACILFNSEKPVDVGVQTYNAYTENDSYNLFYSNRISNLYDPNTRFINGYFDLKLNDIENLRENDVIKIQEQYFIVNKINGFNLTNRELTQVELVQYNNNVQTYPTRYFKYQYCDAPGYCFKIKTDFTNPRLIDTQFGWSVWYDQSIGTFTGSTTPTGFTSCILDSGNGRYVPFTISEITKDQYDNGGCYDISCDTLVQYEWNFVNIVFPNIEYAFGLGLPSFWVNGAGTYEGLNLWSSCASFQTARTTYGILTGSSINHGINSCLPTPTPSPTPSPTPTSTPLGPTPTPTITPTPTLLPPEYRKTVYAGIGYSWELDRSLDSGLNYTDNIATLPLSNYYNITTDYTSKYVMVISDAGIVQSSDSGFTFTSIAIVGTNWRGGVNMTTDGIRRLITNGTNLYMSYNTGVTYNILPTSGITFPVDIKMSGFGNVIVLVNSTYIYVSTDFGSTFNIRYTMRSNEKLREITTSDDGQYISVMTFINNNIYSIRSGNYGATFTIVTLPSLPSYYSTYNLWIGFAMSQNGQYQYACIDNSGLNVSTDYGLTFNYLNTPALGNVITAWASGNNKNLIIQKYGPPFDGWQTYVSFDGGASWQGSIGYGNSISYLTIAPESATPPFTLPPTPTPLPTSTPTPTPSPTPTGITFTDGYTILVNDSTPSYPGTGTTWTSIATGTTYNATMVNGPVWTSGTPGFFTFDGTNDYGDFGLSSTGATTASCSFGAWFKTTTSATQKIIAMRGNDSSGNGWSLFISKQSNNKMGVGVVCNIVNTIEVASTTTLVDNTWYYVYGVWTSGTNLKIYVNGSLENTGAFTFTGLRTSGIGWTLMRGNGGEYNSGSVSEFVTYNRVLTDAEILNNFNATKSEYGY